MSFASIFTVKAAIDFVGVLYIFLFLDMFTNHKSISTVVYLQLCKTEVKCVFWNDNLNAFSSYSYNFTVTLFHHLCLLEFVHKES